MNYREYLFICMSEEAVEVSHAAHKVIRFTEHDSYEIGGPTNFETLNKEYNEFLAVVELMKANCIELKEDRGIIERKKARLKDYMAYSKMLGVVDACIN